MNRSARMFKLSGIALWLLGLGVVLVLITVEGWEEVLLATAAAGVWGVLCVSLTQALPMLADALAWRHLVRVYPPPPLLVLFWIRWISEAVNNLLPVASVGGEFLRAWIARRAADLPGPVAGAGVMVDLTLGVFTQILFTLSGLLVLLSRDAEGPALQATVLGGLLLCASLLAFVWVQRAGLFGFLGGVVARIGSGARWTSLVEDGHALDAEARAVYRSTRRLLASAAWRLIGWLAGTLEVWAALWFLGHPVSFLDALLLESLVQAVRSAAFVVPGALGVQEGALILLGGIVGLTPEVALAVSLLKRVRELFWGLPGLLAWQLSNLHQQWSRTSSESAARRLGTKVDVESHQA